MRFRKYPVANIVYIHINKQRFVAMPRYGGKYAKTISIRQNA